MQAFIITCFLTQTMYLDYFKYRFNFTTHNFSFFYFVEKRPRGFIYFVVWRRFIRSPNTKSPLRLEPGHVHDNNCQPEMVLAGEIKPVDPLALAIGCTVHE